MGQNSRRSSTPSDLQSIELESSDGYIVATDPESGAVSQGETKSEALLNLAEAIRLRERPVPEDTEEPEEPTAPWFNS